MNQKLKFSSLLLLFWVAITVVSCRKVILDKDIGSGYKFPTMVEDAKVL